jgi:uncharacterized protein (UPF0548 family)
VFLITKPSEETIRRVLLSQQHCDVSYPDIGASRGTPPAGYTSDHHRATLGAGAAAFERAVAALRMWRMFRLGWLEPVFSGAPAQIVVGADVAVLVRAFGLWSLNTCRIVYVIDESAPVRRFGFAYGTLPEHAESGEERFTIEWRRDDDSVWYDILAFSRPRHTLARLGYPLTRRLQKRFARDSVAAMKRAILPW